MSDAYFQDYYFAQNTHQLVIEQKIENNHCIVKSNNPTDSPESDYLQNYFFKRLSTVRADSKSKSVILCIPIPENGTIPKILNDVFNIGAVAEMFRKALGTGEKPEPGVDVAIDQDHEFFETEFLSGDDSDEDNTQEIRATGVLEFFHLVPEWLVPKLDASIIPFEDRWLVTLDLKVNSTGHILVRPAPLGMVLDPGPRKRVIVTSFMKGLVNTNNNVPYPMEVEFDYDAILGVLDEDMAIPGAGEKTIMAVNELYDSGSSLDEQVRHLNDTRNIREEFMSDVVTEIIDDPQDETKIVKDDELLEVELTLNGHRKEELDLVLEQQIVVYVDPRYVDYARAQLTENQIFLTASFAISFGLYNPGAPAAHIENIEENDYLQFFIEIKNEKGGKLTNAIQLFGKPLWALAKLKIPTHLPQRKPEKIIP